MPGHPCVSSPVKPHVLGRIRGTGTSNSGDEYNGWWQGTHETNEFKFDARQLDQAGYQEPFIFISEEDARFRATPSGPRNPGVAGQTLGTGAESRSDKSEGLVVEAAESASFCGALPCVICSLSRTGRKLETHETFDAKHTTHLVNQVEYRVRRVSTAEYRAIAHAEPPARGDAGVAGQRSGTDQDRGPKQGEGLVAEASELASICWSMC